MKNSFQLQLVLMASLVFCSTCACIGQTTEPQQVIVKPSIDLQSIKNQILTLVNAERARSEYKTAEIQPNDNLSRLAQTFADDMVARHFFNHVDPDGNTCRERAKRLKLASPQAESILAGVLTGDEAVEEFMSDPPRAVNSSRANILNPEFRYLGVGIAQKPSGTLVVVLEFSKK
ncbi:MAG: CAP domain-containing protein [Candidatus Obscuribacterales bacterium]|nr:CAP domain-containing protein [Candidatus Obscuribacterales bacterium]